MERCKNSGHTLPLLFLQRHIGQTKYWLAQATHGHGGVDGDGVRLHEQVAGYVAQLLPQLRLGLRRHELAEQTRNDVGGYGDNSMTLVAMPRIMALIIVTWMPVKSRYETNSLDWIASRTPLQECQAMGIGSGIQPRGLHYNQLNTCAMISSCNAGQYLVDTPT